jgi:hypothetical protein
MAQKINGAYIKFRDGCKCGSKEPGDHLATTFFILGRNLLNKEICKQCINKMALGSQWGEIEVQDGMSDDEVWDEYGKVACPPCKENEGIAFVDIEEEPPTWCVYKLEHLVSSNESQ